MPGAGFCWPIYKRGSRIWSGVPGGLARPCGSASRRWTLIWPRTASRWAFCTRSWRTGPARVTPQRRGFSGPGSWLGCMVRGWGALLAGISSRPASRPSASIPTASSSSRLSARRMCFQPWRRACATAVWPQSWASSRVCGSPPRAGSSWRPRRPGSRHSLCGAGARAPALRRHAQRCAGGSARRPRHRCPRPVLVAPAGGSNSSAAAGRSPGPGSWRRAMRRVVSLYLPSWPTDRVRRQSGRRAPPRDEPMITAIREGSRRIIAAVDDAARALGLRPGQTVAHAQALVPDLTIVPARLEADAAALARLAAWCLRYAPIVAPDPPDGIFIDIAGAAHLRGGEYKLLDDLVARLNRAGITVQASVADTPATAWAVARYGWDRVGPPGRMADAIASLPIQALRLSAETVASLREVGIERVAQLAAKSPGPLKLRFGPEVLIRLDQALGHEPDLFEPLLPPDIPQCKRAFAEPIGDPEDLKRVVGDLTSA